MTGLGNTIALLTRWRRDHEAARHGQARQDGKDGRRGGRTLTEHDGFGSNPGNLRMLAHVPADLPPGAPLVVVLHGCVQTAEAYDHGSGWSELADRHGFALLFPEQRRANNPNLCFNWFLPGDTARDQGEALSIRQMVARMVELHGLDPARVMLTGLSAGGAMAASVLAAYPEVFAAGAVIAGMAQGSAATLSEALESMAHGRARTDREWVSMVRDAPSLAGGRAGRAGGTWPRLSIWHGTADKVVAPANAAALEAQWTGLHGLTRSAGMDEVLGPHRRRTWQDPAGGVVVESWTIAGLAHAVPIDPEAADPDARCGHQAPFFVPAGISATWRIARFFGLIRPEAAARQRDRAGDTHASPPAHASLPAHASPPAGAASDLAGIITRALRSAGLIGD